MQGLKRKGDLKGLILDLRGNPGGLLAEAVNVSNLFLDKGQKWFARADRQNRHKCSTARSAIRWIGRFHSPY